MCFIYLWGVLKSLDFVQVMTFTKQILLSEITQIFFITKKYIYSFILKRCLRKNIEMEKKKIHQHSGLNPGPSTHKSNTLLTELLFNWYM